MTDKRKSKLFHADGGPQSELARYAFGWSDKKPGLTYWAILAIMAAFVLYNMITIEWTP